MGYYDSVTWNSHMEQNLMLRHKNFAAFSITTGRMLIVHLPGGKYHNVELVATVPTTNVDPEREKEISTECYGKSRMLPSFCIILYSHNRTIEQRIGWNSNQEK